MDIKKNILDQAIIFKAKLLRAYELNLDKDRVFQADVEKNHDELVSKKYYETVVLDHIAPDDLVKKVIDRRAIRFEVSDILIGNKRFHPSIKRSRQEARELAKRVVKLAKSGEKFEDLVAQYSDDPVTKAKSGKMPVFSWGRMAHVREFADAVWDLKVGEISDPIDTRIGVHIARLEKRMVDSTYVPDHSEENKYRIKRVFYSGYTDSARTFWEDHVASLKEEYEYEIVPGAVDQIINLLRQKILDQNIEYDDSQDLLDITLATYKGGEITFRTIMNQTLARFKNTVGKYQNQYVLNNELDQISLKKLTVADADKYGIKEKKDVKEKLKVFFEQRLKSMVEKQEVNDKIEISDDDVKQYYETNLDKFRKPDEMEIWEIHFTEKQKAEEILERAKKGESFTSLARKYSEANDSRAKGGYLGYQTQREQSTLSVNAFKLGPDGKIGGPINYKKGWSIFKTGVKRKAPLRPLEEVIKRAQSLTLSARLKEKRLAWEQELLNNYETVIYEDVLEEL
jgi:parvulin-like peptidyl-prolyl isomerase